MADVAEDPVVTRDYPARAESLAKAASQQLREMATVGGNLVQRTRCTYFRHGEPFACNKREPGSGCAAIGGLDRAHAVLGTSDACIATFPGDWPVALVAFDAQVDVLGPDGARTVALADLYREPGQRPDLETTLRPQELLLRIRVPATTIGRGSTYHKIRDRESYAFALASAAAAVALNADGTVADVRLGLGGVATRPWRAAEAERTLVGRPSPPRPPGRRAKQHSQRPVRGGRTASRSNSGSGPSPTRCGSPESGRHDDQHDNRRGCSHRAGGCPRQGDGCSAVRRGP
jgi:xanthine dehydrogenase YagS FAD-binding subunit